MYKHMHKRIDIYASPLTNKKKKKKLAPGPTWSKRLAIQRLLPKSDPRAGVGRV